MSKSKQTNKNKTLENRKREYPKKKERLEGKQGETEAGGAKKNERHARR